MVSGIVKPLATTPDYGQGLPSVNPNVISAASINSLIKHVSTEASLTVGELDGSTEFLMVKFQCILLLNDISTTFIPQNYIHVENGGWKTITEIRLMAVWF